MTTVDAAAARPRKPSFDVFQPIWRLLTSVRFAVFFIATLALFGLVGVLIPQVPEAMRGNAAATQLWLDHERGTFGPLTGAEDSLSMRTSIFTARSSSRCRR